MQAPAPSTKHEERLLRFALAFGIVLGLICLYYFEEDWRGKRTWIKTKQELEAKGASLDWTNYIPAVIPEEENFFAAPKMQRWFSGRGGNDLSSRISWGRDSFLAQYDSEEVAEVKVVKPGENVAASDEDIILEYDAAQAVLVLSQPKPRQIINEPAEIIPLIVMDEVPLSEAIKALARQAGVHYIEDPKISGGEFNPDGTAKPEPTVSFRWEKLTGAQALAAVLKNYNLQYIPNPANGSGRIIKREQNGSHVFLEQAASAGLSKLLTETIAGKTNDNEGQMATTGLGMALLSKGSVPAKPLRIVVRAETMPTTNEVAEFFPAITNAHFNWQKHQARVEAKGSNVFNVRLDPPPRIPAKDYVIWSDKFEGEFDMIREALARPSAQVLGDYREPLAVPIPNFICVRILAQTLADRTRCQLLMGEPEEALKTLTLLRDMSRLLEGRPTGRPMTLVAAMINSAITSLYVDTVAEGLRLHAWHEPQLVMIQEQLRKIDLLPSLAEAIRFDRTSSCRVLEDVTADQFNARFTGNSTTNFWQKFKDPTYLFLKLGPRGWVCQNLAKIGWQNQRLLEGFNTDSRRISPRLVESVTEQIQASFKHLSPYTFLVAQVTPNFTRAVQTLAKNQTMANEAQIACALERHRLARGQYPTTLGALVPQFINKVPTDMISGQAYIYREEGEKFALYSVGWNEKDDEGVAGPLKDGWSDIRKGDWVWPDSLK